MSSEDGVIDLKNAARSGDKDLVVKLLDQGIDPNQFGSQSTNAKSPLMVACENGHGEIAEVLIARGAEVDLKNGDQTALSQAVSSENVEMTGLLLKHKANVHFDRAREESAVVAASKKGNVDLVELLVPYDSWDNSGYIHHMFSEAMSNGHTNVVKSLLQSKHIGFTPELLVALLHYACREPDNPEIVKFVLDKARLLDKKPDIIDGICDLDGLNVPQPEKGFTALMLASARGFIEVVKLLLDRGAKIDYQSKLQSTTEKYAVLEGLSSLMVACISDKLEIVKLLLKRGAKVDLRTKTGKNALMLSTNSGCPSLNASWLPATSDINVELIRLLLSNGASVDFQDEEGGTALVYAVMDRSLEAVKLLLGKNAKVDIGTDQFGTPPLHVVLPASQSYPVNAEIARLLIEGGAPVDLVDHSGQTPLIVACSQAGKAELVKLLIKKEAKINHLDKEGGYALLYAVRYAIQSRNLVWCADQVFEIIELLLDQDPKKGAKAAIKADNGESALSLMEKNAALLLQKIGSARLKFPKLLAILGVTGPEVTEQMNDQDLQRSRVQDESDTNMDALFESMSDEEHAPSRNDEEQPTMIADTVPMLTQTGSMAPSSFTAPSTGPVLPPSSTASPSTGLRIPPSPPSTGLIRVPPSSTTSPSRVPSSSTASPSTGPGVPPSSTASPTPIPTHAEVKRYLKCLTNTGIINVGLNLGLDYTKLKNVREDVLMNEMISCWRREDDDVITTSGRPSWLSLVKALEEEGHNGVAARIKSDKLSCS